MACPQGQNETFGFRSKHIEQNASHSSSGDAIARKSVAIFLTLSVRNNKPGQQSAGTSGTADSALELLPGFRASSVLGSCCGWLDDSALDSVDFVSFIDLLSTSSPASSSKLISVTVLYFSLSYDEQQSQI